MPQDFKIHTMAKTLRRASCVHRSELNYAAPQAKFHVRSIGRVCVRFAAPRLNFTSRRAEHRSLRNLIYVARARKLNCTPRTRRLIGVGLKFVRRRSS